MTIDEQIKRALGSGPLTSHQIAKAIKPNLTPTFKQEVRSAIKGMITDGELVSSGAGKGTYYAIAGANTPKPKTPKPDTNIVAIVAKSKAAGMRMGEIAKAAGSSPELIRPIVLSTLATGAICVVGVRAQSRYYMPEHAPSEAPKPNASKVDKPKPPPRFRPNNQPAIVKPPTKKAKEALCRYEMTTSLEYESMQDSGMVVEATKAPTKTVEDAVYSIIDTLKVGKQYFPATIAKLAADKYGVSQLKAHERLTDMIRANDAALFADWIWRDGRNLQVWRPRAGEVRPNRDDIDRSKMPKL